jgi:N-hydroxyarylamine O-acetyltransferase
MDLQAYLDRIGFEGTPRPDLATLRALHRRHLLAIPYENLDVQLGRPVTRDPADAFAKLVGRRRGGWCYEMNGLLGAALDAVGFKVTRLAGGVHRMVRGDEMVGNHLVLLVHLDGEPWIADVGFGDGPLEPYPLREGAFRVAGFDFRLERLDPTWWRFHNHPWGAPTFDFTTSPADADQLEARCRWLQTAPDSNFVLNAVVQRHVPDGLLQLRGRGFRRVSPSGDIQDRLIGSPEAYVALLADEFGLDLPEAADLWPRICARHDELFAAPA